MPGYCLCILIAGQINRISLTVIESGTATFFVALAKDPEIFQMTNRNRFDDIFRNYPQVLKRLLVTIRLVKELGTLCRFYNNKQFFLAKTET